MNNIPILLTSQDPWEESTNGQTTFARNMIKVFGEDLAVAANSSDNIPVGKWIQRVWQDKRIWFYNRGCLRDSNINKPFIPARITLFLNALKHIRGISKFSDKVFIDAPELMLAASLCKWDKFCFRLAGVANPVALSRYRWLRIFSGLSEYIIINRMRKMSPDVIFAAADEQAIDDFIIRINGVFTWDKIVQLPTRVDTDIFYPMERQAVREQLQLPHDRIILTTTGRINWVKGWELLLNSLKMLLERNANYLLIFVGDGEDHKKLNTLAGKLGIEQQIKVTGFLPHTAVVKYINAADVCLIGSHVEGWSQAMCENIACGRSVVTTDVSGAHDIIENGINGFIVSNRNPVDYADAIERCLSLDFSLDKIKQYSIVSLRKDIERHWNAW